MIRLRTFSLLQIYSLNLHIYVLSERVLKRNQTYFVYNVLLQIPCNTLQP